MFGDSTIFGEGARDDYTIPSQLRRMLEAASYCAKVTNFGQDAYVSSRELLMPQVQLRRGKLPDLATFYDGINDSESARMQGEAGLAFYEESRRKEFNQESFF